MIALPSDADAWRVAALTMMSPEELEVVLSSNDAVVWVKAAAACGIAAAQVRLGRMHLDGTGAVKDERAAFACFRAAAEAGDADGQNMLGRACENGWGTAQDFARAAECYAKAADSGHAWAQYNLGHLLLDGAGVPQDRVAAFESYLRAALQGHERAMSLVGRCFEEGWGVEQNMPAARGWYRRSAEAGYFRGAFNYGLVLAAEGAIAEAAIWLARALENATAVTAANMRQFLATRDEAELRALAIQTSSLSSGRATSA